MSQPRRPRITGLQSVRAASATVAAMPTRGDANSRGRARMTRHTQGARRVSRFSVFIRIADEERLKQLALAAYRSFFAAVRRHPSALQVPPSLPCIPAPLHSVPLIAE